MESVPEPSPDRVRIGRGDVVPLAVGAGQAEAIDTFLKELSRLVPECVEDLTTRPIKELASLSFEIRPTAMSPILSLIALRWTKRWHVTAPWAERAALHNLTEALKQASEGLPPLARLEYPTEIRHGILSWLADGGPLFERLRTALAVERDIIVSIRTSPVTEQWQDVEDRARADFERQLTDARSRFEAASQVGKQQYRLSASFTRTTEHFRWLVRYQNMNQSYRDISRLEFRGRKTVKDGVQEAAKLLELGLRAPDPPGRPPKLGRNRE